MTADSWLADTRISYATVAISYADQLRDALAAQPHLRAALALFADIVHSAGGGPVADVGCGPGHVTAHLRELGIDAFGIDLSPAMVEVARLDHPGLRFEVGSMTDLDLADASVAGLLAWWSLVHIPDDAVPTVPPPAGSGQKLVARRRIHRRGRTAARPGRGSSRGGPLRASPVLIRATASEAQL